MTDRIFFESFDGKIYEVFCDMLVNESVVGKSIYLCRFMDGKMFDMDKERKEMFDYIKEEYKDIKK